MSATTKFPKPHDATLLNSADRKLPLPDDFSSVDRAYREILKLISNRQFTTSTVFSHRQLAQHIGMSRQPIAAALDRLEFRGIIESTPRVGTRLKPADADGIWDMIQFRIALECQTARLAAEWMPRRQAPRLVAAAERVDIAFANGDLDAGYRHDAEFHLLVAEFSGSHLLRRELELLGVYQVLLLGSEIVRAAEVPLPVTPNDHGALTRAILAGDSELAERRMRGNIEGSRVYGFLEWYRSSRKQAAADVASNGGDPAPCVGTVG